MHVGKQDVHQGPDGGVREQAHQQPNVGQPPYLLHGEMSCERHQYSAATAKKLCFKEAALAAQEQASAEEKGEMQAMMFALLQGQHTL